MKKQIKVLILVDNARRDLLSCYLLKLEFEKFNCKVMFCSKRNYSIFFKFYNADIFIISRGDYPFLNNLSKKTSIFLVPCEGARLTPETMRSVFMGRFHNGQNYNQFGQIISNFNFLSGVYLWGSKQQSFLLKENYIDESKIIVAGNPRLDVYFDSKSNHQKKKNNTIGFAISIKSLSIAPSKPNYLKNIHSLFDKTKSPFFPMVPKNRHYEDYVWRDFAIARQFLNVLINIIEKTDLHIKIRVGPFEDPNDYCFLSNIYPKRVTIQKNDELLSNFLSQIDTLVTCWSSTGIESYLSNVPVISFAYLIDSEHLFNHIDKEANGFNTFLKLYYRPKNIEELIELINKSQKKILPISPNKKFADFFIKEFYNIPNNTTSSALIVNDIMSKSHIFNNKKTYDIRNIFNLIFLYMAIYLNKLIYFFKDFTRNEMLEQKQYQTNYKHMKKNIF